MDVLVTLSGRLECPGCVSHAVAMLTPSQGPGAPGAELCRGAEYSLILPDKFVPPPFVPENIPT